jgi:hypothetical protein
MNTVAGKETSQKITGKKEKITPFTLRNIEGFL